MRFPPIEVDVSSLTGFGEYSLAVRQASQCGGVEARERMERVAFHVQSSNGSVQEAEIKTAVMANQDGVFTAIGFQSFAQKSFIGLGMAKMQMYYIFLST